MLKPRHQDQQQQNRAKTNRSNDLKKPKMFYAIKKYMKKKSHTKQ